MTKEPEQSPSGERKSDAIRRLQVGITGLLLVALLVGLSTLLTSETRQGADGVATGSVTANGTAVAADPAAGEGALTDLGVEPAAADSGGAMPTTPEGATPPPVGPLVPDLQPDPQLRGTPRR